MSVKPLYPLRTKSVDSVDYVFDPIRKKWVILTPEEWVRQHVIYLLVLKENISLARIAVERQIIGTKKRFDLLIHDKTSGKPNCIIECKAQTEPVNQNVFNQISRYNYRLNVPYLVITNWQEWMAAKIEKNSYVLLDRFPTL